MTKLLIVSGQNELSVAANIEGVLPAKIQSAKRIEIFFDDDELNAFDSLIWRVFNDTESGIDVSLRRVDLDSTHSTFKLTLEQINLMIKFIRLIKTGRQILIKAFGEAAKAAWWFVDRGICASEHTPDYERFSLPKNVGVFGAVEFMVNAVTKIIKTAHIESPDYYKLERIYFEKLTPKPTEKDIRDDTKCSLLMRHRESRQAYAFEYKKVFYLFSNNLA